ncbi:MAG: nucleotidyltransferase [Clostridia bacterium]|nr:nucleotidyltransferase [Clostridia bacterium]
MNIVGIIAEYNPMHNGHIYHIKKARELTNADYSIVIMSGSFTEQGNIATLDKFTRAKIAVECGADLVLELPTVYATSSAENFAKGAVNILNSLGCVTHLAFGAETEDINNLKKIAEAKISYESEILEKKKQYLKDGITAANAEYLATMDFVAFDLKNILEEPNNLLGVEYLKALIESHSQIKPVLVHRLKTNHRDNKIEENCVLASSTAIREALDNTLEEISSSVPQNTYSALEKNGYKLNKNIWELLKFSILKLGKEGLKNIQDVSEGLENKLYDELLNSSSYDEFIHNVKSKRYTLSRIKRICIYILLGITKEKYTRLCNVNYARVLKVKTDSSNLLSLISSGNTTYIPKVTDEILDTLSNEEKESIYLDILANNISHNMNEDFTNSIVVK